MYNELINKKTDGKVAIYTFQGKDDEKGKQSWEYLLDYIVNAFRTSELPPLGSSVEELQAIEIIDEVYRQRKLGLRCPNSWRRIFLFKNTALDICSLLDWEQLLIKSLESATIFNLKLYLLYYLQKSFSN